ncbi:MAG: thiamine phosphate synthase [Candidatus Binatia bacterium]
MSFRLPSPLYAIADPCGRTDLDPVRIAEEMLDGGARILQLRWKEASSGALHRAAAAIRRRTRDRGALFIVNDRVDVAAAVEADGVHLGQDDLPIAVARRELPGGIVGISTHDLPQACAADRSGADYIGFGPLFATTTKPTSYSPRRLEMLREVRHAVTAPIVAIGGISLENATSALGAGASAVAMISALVLAPSIRAEVERALLSLR